MEEVHNVFEEISPEEYERRQAERRDDDFIVDDEGFGYKDHGGEIWEVQESGVDAAKKSKKRKLNVSSIHTKSYRACFDRKMNRQYSSSCIQ